MTQTLGTIRLLPGGAANVERVSVIRLGDNTAEAARQAGLAADAAASADADRIAAAVSKYYSTRAGGVEATAVGDVFTSDETGELRIYAHVAGYPYYEIKPYYPEVYYLGSTTITKSVAASASDSFTIPVGSVAAGDTVDVGFSVSTGGMMITAQVTAPGIVTVWLFNPTGGTITLTGAIVTARVTRVAAGFNGVFFDTARGDPLTALSYTADANLTVTSALASFSSATASNHDLVIKAADGSVLKSAFDTYSVEAEFVFTSFPATDVVGFLAGAINETLGLYGTEFNNPGGSAAYGFGRLRNADSSNANGATVYVPAGPVAVSLTYTVVGTAVTGTVKVTGYSIDTITTTMIFTATSHEMPRMFSSLGVRFTQGVHSMSALKVAASYPGAAYSFLGDSLTQGRVATVWADGFAQLIRADHPGQVLVAGAPAAQTSDWLTRLSPFTQMAPRYCFVLLGTNDITYGRSQAAFEADYTAIFANLVAANITPIALTIAPRNSATVPTWNTWIKAQGWRYIDIYPSLLGTGTALNAAYDSGDGLHWSTAGHLVVANLIRSYITANGL